jgi:predicted HD phosphohydrolase
MNAEVDHSLQDSLNAAPSAKQRVEVLFEYMRRKGDSRYDEAVTQLEHGLQAADLAKNSDATPAEITSALLHDIGHFMMDENDNQSGFQQEDWCHETVGAELLCQFFGDEVTEPVRLHVPVKRYLCSVDTTYISGLSSASKRSFELQGGKMSAEEIATFESHPLYESAVKIRRWDDGAKVSGRTLPDLYQYTSIVESCIRHESA